MGESSLFAAIADKSLRLLLSNIVLSKNNKDGAVFRGTGVVTLSHQGILELSMTVSSTERYSIQDLFDEIMHFQGGLLFKHDDFYTMIAECADGFTWTSSNLLPRISYTHNSLGGIECSLTELCSDRASSKSGYAIAMYFLQTFEMPLGATSVVVENDSIKVVRNRAFFESAERSFSIYAPENIEATIFSVNSKAAFPSSYAARIAEALQFVTGAFPQWQLRVDDTPTRCTLRLASRGAFNEKGLSNPVIMSGKAFFHDDYWLAFNRYLTYVDNATSTDDWNPVAYLYHNACLSSRGTLDLWALGLCIAVEGVLEYVTDSNDAHYNKVVNGIVDNMTDFISTLNLEDALTTRLKGLIASLKNKRAADKLTALAGHKLITPDYVNVWKRTRNSQAHPKNTKRSMDPIYYQTKLLSVHKIEILLRQVIFSIIAYEGAYTDYGVIGYPSKKYPPME